VLLELELPPPLSVEFDTESLERLPVSGCLSARERQEAAYSH
jgi:hypothetical protein